MASLYGKSAASNAPKYNTGVNEPSDVYNRMAKGWNVLDALHSGTRGMRELGVAYLPKEPRESDDAYQLRLERSVLFPGAKKAIRNLTGKAFNASVSFKEGTLNEEWDQWFRNIDLAGTPLPQFMQEVFASGLKYGHTSLLADYPKIPARATLFDERQVQKARPYLVHRDARSIIGWRTALVNNEQNLSRVRIRECVTQYEGRWDDDGDATRVRVIEPGYYEVWIETADGDWKMDEAGSVTIADRIPIYPIYFDKCGVFESKPPMEDLAWTNVAHWQSYSDQRTILRVARVPMLCLTGVDEKEVGDSVTVGVATFTALRNPNANMRYVEHSGASIAAGRQDCLDLEERMYMLAAEPMMSRAGSDTATGRVLDARDATSPLSAWVSAFEHSVNEAFEAMAEFAGLDSSPEMQMSRDFGILGQTSDIDALMQARISGEISRKTFLSEMQRRGVLSETFDAEADEELLKSEEPAPPEPGGLDEREPDDEIRKGEGDNAGRAS